jgi:hypothetical protein
VNPGVFTEMNVQYPCGDANAGDLFEELGLIKDAHAIALARCSVHTLSGPNGGAFGYLTWNRYFFRFNLPRGECAGFITQCCQPG